MTNWLAKFHQLALPHWHLIAGVSMALAIISLLLIPVVCLALPADYFIKRPQSNYHPVISALIWLIRNLFAAIMAVAGILMLVLPGQGLLTLFFALVIADFPGKQALERALIRQAVVYQAANWIRRRYGSPPFIHPTLGKPDI